MFKDNCMETYSIYLYSASGSNQMSYQSMALIKSYNVKHHYEAKHNYFKLMCLIYIHELIINV